MSEGTALNALRRHYLGLEDAYGLTDDELLSIPDFGRKSLEWVRSQQAAASVAVPTRKTINIHAPVFRIIRALGLDPGHVKEMTIDQHSVEVTLYKIDEHGAKYLDQAGRPAIEKQTFEVVTSRKPRLKHPFDFLQERRNW